MAVYIYILISYFIVYKFSIVTCIINIINLMLYKRTRNTGMIKIFSENFREKIVNTFIPINILFYLLYTNSVPSIKFRSDTALLQV